MVADSYDPPRVFVAEAWVGTPERLARSRSPGTGPLPWSGAAPPFGFSADATATPWLPQPPAWRELTVAAQQDDPASTLHLYRRALRVRRTHPALGAGELTWLDARRDALVFARAPDFVCAVNVGAEPLPLPAHVEVLCASAPLDDGLLPRDTAAWLGTGD